MTNYISDIRRRAGLREYEEHQYTILEYGPLEGSQPFVSGGTLDQVLQMVNDTISKHERDLAQDPQGNGLIGKIVIVPGNVRNQL